MLYYYYDDLLAYWLFLLSASNWLMRENWWWQFLDKDEIKLAHCWSCKHIKGAFWWAFYPVVLIMANRLFLSARAKNPLWLHLMDDLANTMRFTLMTVNLCLPVWHCKTRKTQVFNFLPQSCHYYMYFALWVPYRQLQVAGTTL